MSASNSATIERRHHDDWAKNIADEEIHYKEFFEASTAPENRYILSQIGDLNDKQMLDLGTGPGEASLYFREKKACVTSFDLSIEMLKYAQNQAQKRSLQLALVGGDAAQLPFGSNVFDIVYGANILHHVPYRLVISEVQRVLKPGGKAYFIEPLIYNPAIKIYRKMAKQFQSPDEKAFRFSELKYFEEYFSEVRYQEFWLTTLWIFIHFFLIDRVMPSKERYWKKIVKEHKRLEKMYYWLEGIDKKILKRFPILRYFCWNVVVTARK